MSTRNEPKQKEPDTPTPDAPSGFFIRRMFGPDGEIDFDVQMVGDAKITEAHTVLTKALQLVDSKLGL